MLKSQKLEIEAGEKRQALSGLVKKDALTDEERGQLDGLTTPPSRYRNREARCLGR